MNLYSWQNTRFSAWVLQFLQYVTMLYAKSLSPKSVWQKNQIAKRLVNLHSINFRMRFKQPTFFYMVVSCISWDFIKVVDFSLYPIMRGFHISDSSCFPLKTSPLILCLPCVNWTHGLNPTSFSTNEKVRRGTLFWSQKRFVLWIAGSTCRKAIGELREIEWKCWMEPTLCFFISMPSAASLSGILPIKWCTFQCCLCVNKSVPRTLYI